MVRHAAFTLAALLPLAGLASAVETADVVLGPDIQFATQAANFQPIGSNYPASNEPMPPPSPPNPPSPPQSSGIQSYPPEQYQYDPTYVPSPVVDPSDCDSSAVLTDPEPSTVTYDARGARARQIPDDWLWGCNGSAYRTGPGNCDDWQVGCRWETSVDGMVLFREDARLAALESAIRPGGFTGDPIVYDQFDYAPGGRVSFIGRYPKWAGYEVQAAYEGIEEWNASIVYPKLDIDPPPTDAIEQSTFFYRSSLQSAELNVLRRITPATRWFGGVRYIRFVDEINYRVSQEAPLPQVAGAITDFHMINDLNNNLIGFQIGGRHDLWQPIRRFTLEGFLNGGVYYNHIKRTDYMSVDTTTFAAGAPPTSTFTNVTNNVVSEPSEIAFVGEASLTAVCRLNKCWACRAGYQVLFIDGLALAEDAFLAPNINETRSLTFQGWHFGVECRR